MSLFSFLRPKPTTARVSPAANQNKPKGKTLIKGAAATTALVGILVAFEGYREQAYMPTPNDRPTICYGATKGVKMGDTATRAECDARLMEEIAEFELGMRKCLKNPDAIPDGVYVAMLDATYNIGYGQKGFCGSTMARRLNAGDMVGACNALPMWNKQAGKVLRGLTRRREAERQICLQALKEAA